VQKVEIQRLSTTSANYKLHFEVNESKKVLIEAVLLVQQRRLSFRDPDKAYGSYPLYHEGKRFYQILHVRRLDSFTGMCQDAANELKVQAELCLCKELSQVSYDRPRVVETLKSNIRPVTSTSKQSCTLACKDQGLTCTDDFSFQLYNTCSELARITNCDICVWENNQAAPLVRGNVCVVSADLTQNGGKCEATEIGGRVCPCRLGS
jgi:hypothetical protein